MNNNHLGVKSVRSLVQPGDGVMPLVKGINSAKKSVEILIFRFDRTEIERALAHAVSRGIFVHALIAYTNRGGEKNLRALEMRLLAAGVTVARTADDFPYRGLATLYLPAFYRQRMASEWRRVFSPIIAPPTCVPP